MARMPAHLLAALLALVGTARAQDAGVADAFSVAEFEGADPFEHEVTEASALLDAPGGPDPMAVLADDDPALAAPPSEDELAEPPVRVQRGAVIEAIAGVRESGHETSVTFAHGLAVVDETLRFASSARHRAEVRYALAVPPGAALASLEVCNPIGCRSGLDDAHGGATYEASLTARRPGPSGLPIAHAALEEDALVVRAAPVIARSELTVRVRWAVVVPVHGGVARLELPASPADLRTSERHVTAHAIDLVEPAIDGASADATVGAASATSITARVPRTGGDRTELLVGPCGVDTCFLASASAPPGRGPSGRVVLALDVSPSMRALGRGRLLDALRVLLAALPDGVELAVRAFAEESAPVAADRDGLLAAAGVALDAELGHATRPDRLLLELDAAGLLSGSTHVVILGDGGASEVPDVAAGWARASAVHARVSVLNLTDRPSARALREHVEATAGVVLEVGREAARAAEHHGDAPLEERVASLWSAAPRNVALGAGTGALRDGESLFATGVLASRSRARRAAIEPELETALAAVALRRAALAAVSPADVAHEGAADGALLAPGRARVVRVAHVSTTTTPVESATGLPPRALLDQLRRRVIPAARGCFRDDRHGRAAYSTRAGVRIVLADRELSEVRIEGTIDDELETCLARAFDGLDIPAFDGTLVVHWGLFTEAEPPPPTLELAPDLSRTIDRIGEHGATPESLLGE